jgi:metal-responsive CopG/Arc/MetJ family transcriptional regulator
MESILLKLDTGMLERIDSLVSKHNYGTRTEFVRASLRTKVEELEREEEIKKVLALKGTLKGQKPVTDRELRKTRIEVGEEYMKKYGLK